MTWETTRRDLKVLRGFVFVPVTWQQITVGDTIIAPGAGDAQTRYVVAIEKHYATALVTVMHGATRQVAEKPLDEAVHVLDDATGSRLATHEGGITVRTKKGQS